LPLFIFIQTQAHKQARKQMSNETTFVVFDDSVNDPTYSYLNEDVYVVTVNDEVFFGTIGKIEENGGIVSSYSLEDIMKCMKEHNLLQFIPQKQRKNHK
jgi:hypothetical protein